MTLGDIIWISLYSCRAKRHPWTPVELAVGLRDRSNGEVAVFPTTLNPWILHRLEQRNFTFNHCSKTAMAECTI